MKRLSALLLRVFLPLSLSLLLSGCAAVVVGGAAGAAAGYVWVKGALKHTLEGPLPRVEQLTRATLAELELVGIDGEADKLKGKITARMADGTLVRIQLKAIDFDKTAIQVRVGVFGDRAVSEQIIRHIERRL